MKHLITALLLAALLATPADAQLFRRWNSRSSSSCPDGNCPIPQGQQPREQVVKILTAAGSFTGSGVYVAIDDGDESTGIVLTNEHVARGHRSLKVLFPGAGTYDAEIVGTDAAADLAALKINLPSVAPMQISNARAVIGDMLTVAGYGGNKYSERRGRVTRYLKGGDVEVGTPGFGGDSGCPILDSDGKVAAILWGSDHRSVSCGPSCEMIRAFLGRLFGRQAETDDLGKAPPPPTVDVTEPDPIEPSEVVDIKARADIAALTQRLTALLGDQQTKHAVIETRLEAAEQAIIAIDSNMVTRSQIESIITSAVNQAIAAVNVTSEAPGETPEPMEIFYDIVPRR